MQAVILSPKTVEKVLGTLWDPNNPEHACRLPPEYLCMDCTFGRNYVRMPWNEDKQAWACKKCKQSFSVKKWRKENGVDWP